MGYFARVEVRLIKSLLAAFWLLWVGVVIPSHTVGLIQVVPGASSGVCPMCASSNAPASRGQQAPAKPGPAAGCAVCNFTAKLCAGTNFDCHLHYLALANISGIPPPHESPSIFLLLTCMSRAPPIFPSV
jgi:hypothetical protein